MGRPKSNYDYCCSSANDCRGNIGINSRADRSTRSDCCQGDYHGYVGCKAPPCSDYSLLGVTSGMSAESMVASLLELDVDTTKSVDENPADFDVKVQYMMDEYDKDGSKTLDRTEVRMLIDAARGVEVGPISDEELDRGWPFIDLDGDGSVNMMELKNLLTSYSLLGVTSGMSAESMVASLLELDVKTTK